MIYLDNAATTLRKPPAVARAVQWAMGNCANPGRGGYRPAMLAADTVFQTRTMAAELFDCEPDQVCFTANATEGLNVALRSLVGRGDRVVISCLEHNAVTRTLNAIGAEMDPAVPDDIFSMDAWMNAFEKALNRPANAVVCMQVSNVFGCRLPVEELSKLCQRKKIPMVVDASQSAGILPVSLRGWKAAFVAMPGHKALFGPQGTGLLLCGAKPAALLTGGTGSQSALQQMPDELPDRLEAGTRNVPGICGLGAGLEYVRSTGLKRIRQHEDALIRLAAKNLREMGLRVWAGREQTGVLSFLIPGEDPEQTASWFAEHGAALRAGLHCAPLAHRSLGTFPGGTLRLSVSALTGEDELRSFLALTRRLLGRQKEKQQTI